MVTHKEEDESQTNHILSFCLCGDEMPCRPGLLSCKPAAIQNLNLPVAATYFPLLHINPLVCQLCWVTGFNFSFGASADAAEPNTR